MPVRSDPNLRLLPDLATGIAQATERYCLPISTLVGILVHNDDVAPAALTALPQGKLSRVFVNCSLRPPLLQRATAGARREHLSRNAYLEALISSFLAIQGPLLVLPRNE